MAERMTSEEYRELARLAKKAALDEFENHDNEGNNQTLIGVSIWADRNA